MTPLTQLLDEAFASVENSARISDGDDAFDNCKTQLRPLFDAMKECVKNAEQTGTQCSNTGLYGPLDIAPGECTCARCWLRKALANLRKVAEACCEKSE